MNMEIYTFSKLTNINSQSPVGTPPLQLLLLLLLAATASEAYASSAERLTTAGRPTRKRS